MYRSIKLLTFVALTSSRQAPATLLTPSKAICPFAHPFDPISTVCRATTTTSIGPSSSRTFSSTATNPKSSTMTARLSTIVQSPRAKHSATVIFLHGLGDSGHGWSPVTAQMMTALPHVKFVLPNAPENPVTINMGMRMPSWYDILTMDIGAESREDAEGLSKSSSQVCDLIRDEIESGIPADRIVLGGFSQGGATTLYTLLTSQYKLAGAVVLSAYLPIRNKIFSGPLASDVNKGTPIFMAHGTADEVIQPNYADMSSKILNTRDFSVTFKTYPGMGHSSSPMEIQDVLQFLRTTLPQE